MPWTIEEIQNHWLGGHRLPLPDDVVCAFATAEQARGREWALGSAFQQVYSVGKGLHVIDNLMQAVTGVPGVDELLGKVLEEKVGAISELEAAHLFRSRRPETEIEFGPDVIVGSRNRRPDFRIREKAAAWTYFEVTQLNASEASESTQSALQRIGTQVAAIRQPFIMEIIFWRDPLDGEEDELVRQACDACQLTAGERRDVGDLASLIVKAGDSKHVIPSVFPEDNQARLAFALSIGGPDEPHRQIMVRAPFADQRAESVLTHEAKQLPKSDCGLVMVDVRRQMTALESWPKLIPPRFTPSQHTRVGGVLLFARSTAITQFGAKSITCLNLIVNPHARIPLPTWITDVVQETKAETRRRLQGEE